MKLPRMNNEARISPWVLVIALALVAITVWLIVRPDWMFNLLSRGAREGLESLAPFGASKS